MLNKSILISVIALIPVASIGSPAKSEAKSNASETDAAQSPETKLKGAAVSLDCPEKPVKKSVARKLAGKLFSDAEHAYTDAKHVEALSLFLCSMSIVPHENTLTNIEKALKEVSDRTVALSLIREYLAKSSPDALNEKLKGMADVIDEEIAQQNRVEETPKCPKMAPSKPIACPKAPVLEAVVVGKNLHRILEITGWAEVGTGAATFIAAIVLQGFASASKNRAVSATDYDDFLAQKEKNRVLQVSATTAFVTGIVFAGAGVTHLYFTKRETEKKDSPDKKTGISLSFLPGIGWAGINGAF